MKDHIHKAFPILIFSTVSKIILLILFTPVFIIFFCPVYLIRFLVIIASKVLRPDLVTTLGVRDSIYGIDDITGNPKSSVVLTMVLKGDVEKETVFNSVTRMLTQTRKGQKDLLYPEFKRYLVKWMGFIFWKEDCNFNVANYIRVLEPPKSLSGVMIGPSELKQIEKYLIQEPFKPRRSPWEYIIVKNYRPDECNDADINSNNGEFDEEKYTAVLFKVHHSFVDGISLLTMFIKEIFMVQSPDTSYIAKANFPKRNPLQNIALGIWMLFKTPYDTLSEILMEADRNSLYLTKDKITNEINTSITPRVDTQKIKDIANGFDVSFGSVVTSAIAGGIRRLMIEQGKDPNKANFSCLSPFPIPGRPDTLGNYLSDCYVDFPIEIADPVKRIKHIDSQYKALKFSTVPLSSFAMQPFIGGLFYWMVEPMVKFALLKSTGILSSFPGPSKQIFWDASPNLPLIDCYFTGGHDNPGIGLQFLGLTYNGGWRLKIQADKGSLSTDAEVDQLVVYVLKEIESYHMAVII